MWHEWYVTIPRPISNTIFLNGKDMILIRFVLPNPTLLLRKKKTNTNISTKPIENLHAWLCWTAIWVHYSPYFKHLVRENKSWCKIYQQVSEYECLQWFKRDEWLKMHNLIKTRINHACLFIGRLCAGRQWYWLDFQLIYTDTVPQIVELFLNGV